MTDQQIRQGIPDEEFIGEGLPRWIVQRYKSEGLNGVWEDVRPPQYGRERDYTGTWLAASAGEAFNRAVISNEHEKLTTTSYRVLAFAGGGTFGISVNVEGEAHD